jgi:tRNA(His) guanylyltransferase
MNLAAKMVVAEYNDIILAYGQSDEYSFVFRREAEVRQKYEYELHSVTLHSSELLARLFTQVLSALWIF